MSSTSRPGSSSQLVVGPRTRVPTCKPWYGTRYIPVTVGPTPGGTLYVQHGARYDTNRPYLRRPGANYQVRLYNLVPDNNAKALLHS